MPDGTARLLELLSAERRFNQLAYTFPDDGPYRRELYPKHMAFITAGATNRERCFMGGNGCITPWTKIETVDGERPIAELIGESSFAVRSWADGSECVAQAGGVFLKELAAAFRVHLDNGRFFDCSHTHRVLTTEGMLQFGELIHAAGGLRYWRTTEGSRANCVEGDRPCDERLPWAGGIDLVEAPSPGDVQKRIRLALREDEEGRTPLRSRVYRRVVHLPSRLYGPEQVAALCEPFEDPTVQLDLRWSAGTRRLLARIATESGRSQEGIEVGLGRGRCDASVLVGQPSGRAVSGTSAPFADERQDGWLCSQPIRSGQWLPEAIDGELGEWIFCPWEHVSLIGGNRIVAVVPLGLQPIFDLTVEDTHTYFAAGIVHHNTGKSTVGAYETAAHATGRYPDWWTGLRYPGAIPMWVGGDTGETVRDITQVKLFGNVSKDAELLGTGMIPRDAIDAESIRYRPNTNRCIDFARVKNKDGNWSIVSMKSYEQGRKAWQGTEIPWIWLDEEPPVDIYGECVMRGRTVDGHIALTFTPLSGWTDVVDGYMKWEEARKEGASKIMVTCGWDDVPHLTEKEKSELLASTPGYLRDARRFGTPVAGKGKVYPIDEKDFVVPPIRLPDHFRRICGFDGGWYNTAAVWLAYDKDSDTEYLYSEYKRGEVEIPVHAAAIKARGLWIPVVGDAAAINQGDGEKILDLYRRQGIRMKLADKAVDAGIQNLLDRMATGRFKVFSTCQKWLEEFRRYSYDDQGRIRKQDDHLMDATRYADRGIKYATTQRTAPVERHDELTFGIYS